jgi:hypothetical protein
LRHHIKERTREFGRFSFLFGCVENLGRFDARLGRFKSYGRKSYRFCDGLKRWGRGLLADAGKFPLEGLWRNGSEFRLRQYGC